MTGPEKLRFVSAGGGIVDFLNDAYRVVNFLGFEGPEAQHRVIESPLRDGSRYINTRYRELFPIVRFEVEGANFANLMARRRTLIPILAPKQGIGTLQFQASAGSDEYHIDALVERRSYAGSPEPRMVFESWTVQFRCPNPYWRSASATETMIGVADAGMAVPTAVPTQILGLAGQSTINNGGDTESWPTFSVTPSGTDIESPTLTNATTGSSLALAGLVVPDGSELVTDMLAQTVRLEGVNVLSYLTATSEFWSLATGSNTVTVAHTSGSGTWTVEHNEYYEGV